MFDQCSRRMAGLPLAQLLHCSLIGPTWPGWKHLSKSCFCASVVLAAGGESLMASLSSSCMAAAAAASSGSWLALLEQHLGAGGGAGARRGFKA
jgi:hypothetical protein